MVKWKVMFYEFLRTFGRWIRDAQFKLVDNFTATQEHIVVFEAYQGRQYSCNPRAIYEAMLREERFLDYQFIWIFREPDRFRFLENNPNTILIPLKGNDYYKAFAKAKYWIVNSRTRHCLKPGKNHCFVQTWHGTPLKRIGCDITVGNGNGLVSNKQMQMDYRKEGNRVTYFLSPSAFYTQKIASAFALGSKKETCMIEKGYPRNDRLFNIKGDEVSGIKEKLNIPTHKRVILYAPTFRDNQITYSGCNQSLGFNMEHYIRQFGETHVMLFRTHYFITNQFDMSKWPGMIVDVSHWDEIGELYQISDLLITDYSSVFFDYANLRRPILFYMYDLEEYRDHIRDFYLDLSELPGDVITTEEQLYVAIAQLDWEQQQWYDERYRNFNATYNYLDGPDTAKNILECLIPAKNSDTKKA